MNRFLKLTLPCALAIVLSLGFASCKDDKKDDGIIFHPTPPTYVPTSLEILDKDGITQEKHGYEYNDKYLLTKLIYEHKDENDKWTSSSFSFKYGEKGKLLSIDIDEKETIDIEYDESGNVVNMGLNQEDKFDYTLDKKGYPTKAYNDFTKVTITYEYDASRNIVKQTSIDESDKDNPIVSTISKKYTNTFSPFAFLKIPTWSILNNAEMLSSSGLRMPRETTYSSQNETKKTIYLINAQHENFPTDIESTTTETNKEGEVTVTKTRLKVKYKEMK